MTASFRRRAAVNKGLLAVLGILVVGAGLYWGFFRSSEPTKAEDIASDREVWVLKCSKCGAVQMNGKEAAKLDQDLKTNKLKCPKCGQFTGSWGGGGAQMLGGGKK